jgi:ammonium transporter Rh
MPTSPAARAHAQISPFLYEKIGLHDTCGIHNLHGMPSLLGALISAAIPNLFPGKSVFVTKLQLTGIGITLAAALLTGVFTGARPIHSLHAAQHAQPP